MLASHRPGEVIDYLRTQPFGYALLIDWLGFAIKFIFRKNKTLLEEKTMIVEIGESQACV